MNKLEVTIKVDTSKLDKAIQSLGNIGKAAIIASGANLSFGPQVQALIAGAIEHTQLLEEIACLTKLTSDEVKEFYEAHFYSLEYIKMAIQAGAELKKEDIERTMVKKFLA